jgi:hypothetical protein
MHHLEGTVRPSYIQDARFLKVKTKQLSTAFESLVIVVGDDTISESSFNF